MLLHYHHVPGRLRIELANFKRNRPAIDAAAHALRALPGVTAVSSSLAIGSLTVTYDPMRLSASQLSAALEAQGCVRSAAERRSAQAGPPLVSKAVDFAAQALLEAMLRQMLGGMGPALARLVS